MNEIQRFPYLENWCKAFYAKTGLKVYPANVPTDAVLNDIMEQVTMAICHDQALVTAYDAVNERVKSLESLVDKLLEDTKHKVKK